MNGTEVFRKRVLFYCSKVTEPIAKCEKKETQLVSVAMTGSDCQSKRTLQTLEGHRSFSLNY